MNKRTNCKSNKRSKYKNEIINCECGHKRFKTRNMLCSCCREFSFYYYGDIVYTVGIHESKKLTNKALEEFRKNNS